MILDLAFPYACLVPGESGERVLAAASARVQVSVACLDERQAPLALRWGPSDSPLGWTHTRFGPSGHLSPLPAADADGRIAAVRAIREGWAGRGADPIPLDVEHLRANDPRLPRAHADDRATRQASLVARAGELVLVEGRPYVPCPEPVAVETGPGRVEVRPGRGVDWIAAHPLTDVARAFPGSRHPLRLAHGFEILLPEAVRIDREQVTARVVRKALIVLRKACEGNGEARRQAALADTDLAGGRPGRAALALSACLRALGGEGQAHPGLREFIARTQAYLGCHAAAA